MLRVVRWGSRVNMPGAGIFGAGAPLTSIERAQLNADRMARDQRRQLRQGAPSADAPTRNVETHVHSLKRMRMAELDVGPQALSAGVAAACSDVLSTPTLAHEVPSAGTATTCTAEGCVVSGTVPSTGVDRGDADNAQSQGSSWVCAVCTLEQSVGDAFTASGAAACSCCATPRTFNPERLTVLTWNIAMCQPSRAAPAAPHFEHLAGSSLVIDPAADAIASVIANANADVVCLQECPSERWADVALAEHDYRAIGSARSHCGFVVVLVKMHLAALADRTRVDGPSVAVRLCLPDAPNVTVVSSHLTPFADGAQERTRQLTCLVAQVATDLCVFAGDFNMRKAEDAVAEKLGGGIVDAWKASGEDRDKKFTWDSYKNKYHGSDAFKFTARFDRVYLRGGLGVQTFELVGSETVNEREGHYLSDHYGILSAVVVLRST
jgi:endonuclease/exonuclease/phosphatase family metal-dependent hydrolase